MWPVSIDRNSNSGYIGEMNDVCQVRVRFRKDDSFLNWGLWGSFNVFIDNQKVGKIKCDGSEEMFNILPGHHSIHVERAWQNWQHTKEIEVSLSADETLRIECCINWFYSYAMILYMLLIVVVVHWSSYIEPLISEYIDFKYFTMALLISFYVFCFALSFTARMYYLEESRDSLLSRNQSG